MMATPVMLAKSESKNARKGIKTPVPGSFYSLRRLCQNQKMPVRALRHPLSVDRSHWSKSASESKNARKGIKTHRHWTSQQPRRPSRSESKNARKGIKTNPLQPDSASMRSESESKNARKGIKTYSLSAICQGEIDRSESKNARKGIKTHALRFS